MQIQEIIDRIENSQVYDVAIKTPLQSAKKISAHLKNEIMFKREDLQSVFSFKCRGAYVKIHSLVQENPNLNGVIAASAGNHAQGVALASKKLKVEATIIMPTVTPSIKVEAVRNLGAKVILHGDRFDDAREMSIKLAKEKKLIQIPPYDDPLVIVGQGTVGLELYQQISEITQPSDTYEGENLYFFVPVGGGGLISGIGIYLKHQYPKCKIISVEPAESPTLYKSKQNGKIIELEKTGVFADGVSVKKIGVHNFTICQKVVDHCILVSNDEICSAVEDIFNETRTITEPSGALALAGLKKYVLEQQLNNKKMIAVVSGANLNFDRLRFIAERSKFGAKKELLLAVAIPERIGSYKEFCRTISNHAITEFNYRYTDSINAQIFVGIAMEEEEYPELIIQNLKNKGYRVLNLMDNEMAKIHIRHMVGGKNKEVKNERLISFIFPERKGALSDFLEHFYRWNISLFHYRSQGAPYGEVLTGIQVPENELTELKKFLDNLGYDYHFEDENKACQIFL